MVNGRRHEPSTVVRSKQLMTDFQNRVYRAVRRIPRGRVTTYKLLAQHINCRSFRAVGQALKRNPFAPDVPCHRVISSNLGIGGFRGKSRGPQVCRKLDLLVKEGVCFVGGKLVDPRRVYRFFLS